MRRAAVLACVLVTSGFTVVRDSDSLEPIRWPDPATVTMVVHDGMASDQNIAVQNSLQVWNNVSGSSFQFQYGGTDSVGGDGDDGVNRISLITSGWAYPSGVVALTMRVRNAGAPDTWDEADIILNADPSASTWAWATDGRAGAHDVQTTVTHELGHVLGLMHAASPEATMYFGGRRGRTQWRTLHPDDIAGARFLYPVASFSCTSDDQCPLYDNYYGGNHEQTACNGGGGGCVVGGAAYGEACFDDGDCESGNCLKGLDLAPASDPGFCTQDCGSCPDNDLCQDGECYLGYDDCVVDQDCVDRLGADWRCPMDLDGRFRCLKECADTGECADVPGTFCHHNEGGNDGFCRVPGLWGEGAECADGYDCVTLVCAGMGVQPTCVGGVGPMPDGAGGPDGGPAGDPVGGDGGRSDDDDSGAVTGGCDCTAGGAPVWVVPLIIGRWRRMKYS